MALSLPQISQREKTHKTISSKLKKRSLRKQNFLGYCKCCIITAKWSGISSISGWQKKWFFPLVFAN